MEFLYISFKKTKKSENVSSFFKKYLILWKKGVKIFKHLKNEDKEVYPMPNIKSAKKRVLVTETKTLQNKMLKSELKTLIKKFDAAVESGDKAAATEAYKVAVKKIDKAVGKSIIAKNTSNRKKSKLTVKLNKMGAWFLFEVMN